MNYENIYYVGCNIGEMINEAQYVHSKVKAKLG